MHKLVQMFFIGIALVTLGPTIQAVAAAPESTTLYVPLISGAASQASAEMESRSENHAAQLLGQGNGSRALSFPEVIFLPDSFFPEGIAVGRSSEFFVGSLGHLDDDGQTILGGMIYRGDLRTGEGAVIVPDQAGQMALGLKVDQRTNNLFVAGGFFGTTRVYDAATGDLIASYQLASTEATVVNDLVVTKKAVYFTDSFQAVIYRLPLAANGALPEPSAVEEIPLGGDFASEPGQFNSNGIVATPNGKWLILVNGFFGTLYRVDPATGEATEIDLGGETVPNGDGLVLDGKTLYVVQNTLNQIAVVELTPELTAGTIVRLITDDDFDGPTTAAEFGNALYAVNARFDDAPPLEPDPPALEYQVVRVPK